MSLKRLEARLSLAGVQTGTFDGKMVCGGMPPWLKGKGDKKDDKKSDKKKSKPPWLEGKEETGKKGADKSGKKSSKPPWLKDDKKKAKANVESAHNAQDDSDSAKPTFEAKTEPHPKATHQQESVNKKESYSKLIEAAAWLAEEGVILIQRDATNFVLAAHPPHPYYYPAGISAKGWKKCWIPMWPKHAAPIEKGGWGAAINIYKHKCKKEGIDPYGEPKAPPVGKNAAKHAA